MKTKAYAASSATTPLAPFSLERRVPGEHDINAYLFLLKLDGNLTQVGVGSEPL